MPDQIVVGLAYKVLNNLSVMADWQHTNWKLFQTLALNLALAPSLSEYENFHATDAFRAGLDWQATRGSEARRRIAIGDSDAHPPRG